jgi:hypothetical protein
MIVLLRGLTGQKRIIETTKTRFKMVAKKAEAVINQENGHLPSLRKAQRPSNPESWKRLDCFAFGSQ